MVGSLAHSRQQLQPTWTRVSAGVDGAGGGPAGGLGVAS